MSAPTFSRRRFLQISAAGAGALLLPLPHLDPVEAAPLVNPYTGSIPLVFPLVQGTYKTPVQDNWHVNREGQIYTWNHQNAVSQRAHDGVDVFPANRRHLPVVYSPIVGVIAAICTRTANSVGVAPTYTVNSSYAPPWNYSQAIDTTANLPLYGNFVWIYSQETASAGYYVFFCHLQYESTITALQMKMMQQPAGAAVTTSTQLGVMGDTGNAVGAPQLHTEIHYPGGATYTCSRCSPGKSATVIDSEASLTGATLRASMR